ncbi:MAG: hypothetical protein ABI321_23110 [Polyangia bacterium]
MNKGLILGLLLAVGCGGSSMTVDEYAAKQNQLQCEFEVKCCQKIANAVVYTDVPSCETTESMNNAAGIASAKAAILAGTLKFDSGKAAKCQATLKSLTSSCTNTLDHVNGDDCNAVLVGGIPIGAACGSDAGECVPGSDCISSVCVKDAAAGANCYSSDGSTSATCATGLQCDYDGSMTCVTPKSDGAACVNSSECKSFNCQSAKCQAESSTSQPVTTLCESMAQPE